MPDQSGDGAGGAGSASAPPVLAEAARQILKATLVPLQLPNPDRGRAVLQHSYVRSLGLQPGEVESVRGLLVNLEQPVHNVPWDLLTSFEAAPAPSLLPAPGAFGDVPPAAVRAFGGALAALRRSNLSDATGTTTVRSLHLPAIETTVGAMRSMVNRAVVANAGFDFNLGTTPIGMLNLERVEMAPAGMQRGELIGTIPLAPLEQAAVTTKEWSVTSREFTSIVTDSLENYSETGVTDNTELTQSTTSQIQHNNQFNITGTVSGGIPIISGSVTSGFTAQDASSLSATESRKHTNTITQKASTRAKREHKVTISTRTETGTSEESTRVLTNPSQTDPMRVDYFSMIRDWRVRLYRYGLRLTYDIVIPEPAGAMREAYAELDRLQSSVGPFVFTLAPGDITDANYQQLAGQYGASISPPPEPEQLFTVEVNPAVCPDKSNPCGVVFSSIGIPQPAGYAIDSITVDGGAWGYSGKGLGYGIIGTTFFQAGAQPDQEPFPTTRLVDTAGNDFLSGAEGPQTIGVFMNDVRAATLMLTVRSRRTTASYVQWQSDAWSALYAAAQNRYYAEQQDLVNRIAELQARLNNVDTLTLRREESDEVMKGVLRFLLGIDFDLMPQDVLDAFTNAGTDIAHGVGFLGDERGGLGMSAGDWQVVTLHEDMVRFINQAIEWENVVAFLYSYFWDIPASWTFIRAIQHPDPDRQAFLRAGSARVVLTVRKGWEEAWVRFAEGGFEGAHIPNDHPYLTIAQEIAAYDDRNYPGIPPANPGETPIRLEDAVVTTGTAAVSPDPGSAPVSIPVESSTGFLVGAQVTIDVYDERKVQESAVITAIRDATHIVVSTLMYSHTVVPFPVVQPGEKGTLIAEWHEYTPTSGIDIAVTSNLATIV